MSDKVLVSAGWCSQCPAVKKYIEDNNIEVTILDADKDFDEVNKLGVCLLYTSDAADES